MKKLMFVAAAVAAGVAVADVTSANVVGYQTMAFAKNTWTMTADTFIPVGSADMKLGNLIPKGVNGGTISINNFYLKMIDTNGKDLFVKNDKRIAAMEKGAEIQGKFKDSQMVEFAWVAAKNAWYLKCDSASGPSYRKYPMTDYKIPAGAGFLVCVTDDAALPNGVSFTYSGEVAKDPFDLDVAPMTFQITANIAPRDMKLSEFTITANEGSSITINNFYLKMIDTNGKDLFVKNDTRIAALEKGAEIQTKFNSSQMVEFAWVAAKNAWYLKCDSASGPSYRKYPMSDYTIPAGAGFLVYADAIGPNGATFTLPAALKK